MPFGLPSDPGLFLLQAIAFILLLGVMIFVHELGHFFTAKKAGIKVEEFGFGYPPRVFAVRRGETEYSLNLIPLGGFVKLLGEEDPSEPRSFARAPKRWRVLVLIAGSAMNILLAILLFAGSYLTGSPVPDFSKIRIDGVAPNSPAAQAGFQPNDLVVSVNGRPVENPTTLQEETRATAQADQTMSVVLNRSGQNVTVEAKPRSNPPPGEGALGIRLGYPTKESVGPVEALWLGTRETFGVITATFVVPFLALRGDVPAEVARPTGPWGIAGIVGQATEASVQSGWVFPLFRIGGLLGAALGIANLLPIPGLDGGRLVFILIEAIRGRRVSPEREGLVHLVGLGVLISLVVLITYYDIVTPLPRIDWGVR